MKICLIGNSGRKKDDRGGQTTKLRLYRKKIMDEGFDLLFIDLDGFYYHPISIMLRIKKTIKKVDRIVLISGHRACGFLIPFINTINKKYHKPFILPLVGSGLLHYSLDNLNEDETVEFFINRKYTLAKRRKRIEKELSKIDYILPETKLMKDTYEAFYHLDNCILLNNFRDDIYLPGALYPPNKVFKIVFLSRIIRIKGIFDLLEAIKQLNLNYQLDIYGDKSLDREEELLFNSYLDDKISYIGSIDNQNAVQILSKYDLLVFPSRYLQEGMPGVISESLIAGTPILTSNFPQASSFLIDGYNSIFYELFNVEDLKQKLLMCLTHPNLIKNMRINVQTSANKFVFSTNRNLFLKYICGVDNKTCS